MNGTLKITFVPLTIGVDEVQVAVVVPLAEQDQPLLVVVSGNRPNLVPVGICTTTVTSPTVVLVPIFVTVTGIKLVWLTIGTGTG